MDYIEAQRGGGGIKYIGYLETYSVSKTQSDCAQLGGFKNYACVSDKQHLCFPCNQVFQQSIEIPLDTNCDQL